MNTSDPFAVLQVALSSAKWDDCDMPLAAMNAVLEIARLVHQLESLNNSLELSIAAERHVHKKDNQYLLGERDRLLLALIERDGKTERSRTAAPPSAACCGCDGNCSCQEIGDE